MNEVNQRPEAGIREESGADFNHLDDLLDNEVVRVYGGRPLDEEGKPIPPYRFTGYRPKQVLAGQ